MGYNLRFTPTAQKDIRKPDAVVKKRLQKKLEYFMSQADPLKLATQLKDFRDGDYRWRAGNYRIIFMIKAKTIVILRVQHRSEVYKFK